MFVKAIHELPLESRDSRTHAETEETLSGLLGRLIRGSLQKPLDGSLGQGLEHLERESEQRAAPTG